MRDPPFDYLGKCFHELHFFSQDSSLPHLGTFMRDMCSVNDYYPDPGDLEK